MTSYRKAISALRNPDGWHGYHPPVGEVLGAAAVVLITVVLVVSHG